MIQKSWGSERPEHRYPPIHKEQAKSFVQLSIQDYEDLKQRAEQQDIPVSVGSQLVVWGEDGSIIEKLPVQIKINMRELKLQICRQQGIDPESTVVEFY